jgi:hypothetical protein
MGLATYCETCHFGSSESSESSEEHYLMWYLEVGNERKILEPMGVSVSENV